jgi:hypothetical protein
MRNGQAGQSVSCADGEHDDCPHMRSIEYRVNPFRLRPKSAVLLCKCECHAPCPVISKRRTVPVPAWRESCTCPAAAGVPSSVGRGQDTDATQTPYLSPARVAALNAAGDQAAGQSREQVKEFYKAELRARGLDIPMEAVLDVEVSLITGGYPAGTGSAGRALIGSVKRLHGIGRPPR